jgi:hypothetical protein
MICLGLDLDKKVEFNLFLAMGVSAIVGVLLALKRKNK